MENLCAVFVIIVLIFKQKNTITARIGSKTHLRNKEKKEQQIKKTTNYSNYP